MSSWSPKPGDEKVEQSSAERIRDAALKCFAVHGTATTSLRQIAGEAGVSIGLVQHHYGTKTRLIEVVDQHVLAVLGASLATPASPPSDSVDEFGQRVISLILQQPDVIDYIGRTLIDGNPIGAVIFDDLVAMGEARWKQRADQHLTAPDLDHTWAALNPLILVLGAITMRTHLDRHLPEPFTSTTQLTRWQDAVNILIRDGQLRHGDEPLP